MEAAPVGIPVPGSDGEVSDVVSLEDASSEDASSEDDASEQSDEDMCTWNGHPVKDRIPITDVQKAFVDDLINRLSMSDDTVLWATKSGRGHVRRFLQRLFHDQGLVISAAQKGLLSYHRTRDIYVDPQSGAE